MQYHICLISLPFLNFFSFLKLVQAFTGSVAPHFNMTFPNPQDPLQLSFQKRLWKKTSFTKQNESNQVINANSFRSTTLSPSLRTNTVLMFWSPFIVYSLHCLICASSELETVHSAETCVTDQCSKSVQPTEKNNPLKSCSNQYENQTSSMNKFN